MEHIIQFGVSIDDERIEQQTLNSIAKEITKDVEKTLGVNSWGKSSIIHSMAEQKVQDVIDEYRDDIIEKASDKLAEKIMRSKAFKEKKAAIIDKEVK